MSGFDERRFQVFVSSTFEDLQEERQKVLQAVLEMKAFPAGMELFPSADDEQWAFIQREIESSDYYVLITAGKYGSIAPEGISFTEKEFDYAVSLKKYVMSFVRNDLSKVAAGQSELNPERRQKLEAFQQKVRQSKLVRFYANPDELKSHVMQALMRAFQFQPMEGWVRAKNARRMEDLEEVARLQSEISQLAKQRTDLTLENQKLSSRLATISNSPLLLAQGDDPVELSVGYEWKPSDPDIVATVATQGSFIFKSTWNHLFIAIFGDLPNRAGREQVLAHLQANIAEVFTREHPEFSAPTFYFDVKTIATACRIQFQGLGLINVGPGTDTWFLSDSGIKQLVGIRAIRRQQATTT